MTESRQLVIGMLGGMSWESSAQYYRLANELVRERLGGLHSARCVLASLDFAEVERLQADERWDDAAEVLADAARRLEAAGADLLVLCTNTMHKVAGEVQAAVGIPLLHIADATAQAVRRSGVETLGLLGTAFTMEQGFYRERLEGHGLRVLVPSARDRADVHRIIYDELCLGVVRSESRERYREVIRELVEAGARGIVLGCTEIELLISASDSPVPVFPTTRIHVTAAVEAALPPLAADDPLAVEVVTAIRAGDLDALRRALADHPWLARAAIADRACNGSRTPLHVATDWPGHFPNVGDVIRVLVAAGADVNARGRAGIDEAPLHWAASSDDVEAIDALLDAGADVDIPGAVIAGGTPLADAVAFAQWNAARRLVERGATVPFREAAALGLADRVAAETDATSDEVSMAFWYACHGGQRATAEMLLDRGAAIDWRAPWDGLTPLDAAMRSEAHALAEWLRERGAGTPGDAA